MSHARRRDWHRTLALPLRCRDGGSRCVTGTHLWGQLRHQWRGLPCGDYCPPTVASERGHLLPPLGGLVVSPTITVAARRETSPGPTLRVDTLDGDTLITTRAAATDAPVGDHLDEASDGVTRDEIPPLGALPTAGASVGPPALARHGLVPKRNGPCRCQL